MRRVVVYGLFLLFSFSAFAEGGKNIYQLIYDLKQMGGNPTVVEKQGNYMRFQLTDSATLEIYESLNDIVVMTVCAPQCSSRAGVYNKEGEFLFSLDPSVSSIFPLATMDKDTGSITWVDNDTWEY